MDRKFHKVDDAAVRFCNLSGPVYIPTPDPQRLHYF